MSATIYDVSRLSGVSIATISRTFSHPDKVKESTRNKVVEAARILNYSPNAIARSMARQRTNKIAFIICKEKATILDEFYAGICEGCMRAINKTDYQLIISTAEDWGLEADTAQSRQIDGVILAGNASPEMVARFNGQRIPVILANNRMAGMDYPCVLSNEYEAVSAVIRHLIEGGREKIVMLLGRFSPYIVAERYNSFMKISKEHGMSMDKECIKMCDANVGSATEAALQILRRKDRPDGVIGGNDVIAAGVIKAAGRLGLRVPEDVAVAGFDDSLICAMLEPELTSVHIDCHRIGEICVERMMSLLEGRACEMMTEVEPRLQVRGTT